MNIENLENPTDVSTAFGKKLSKQLFGGARYRLEVGRAICEAQSDRRIGIVNTTDLANELGLSRQSVNQELLLLARSGLLVRKEHLDSERKVYWEAQESSYWKFCGETWSRAEELVRRGQSLT